MPDAGQGGADRVSWRLQDVIWTLKLPTEQRVLLLALAKHANDDGGSCYPGVRLLAWELDKTERSVQRGLSELKAAGLIRVVAYPQGGRGRSTEWQITLGQAERKPPYRAENGDTDDIVDAVKGDAGVTVTAVERVTSVAERVTPVTERVTPVSQNGDTGVTPKVIKDHAKIRDSESVAPATETPAVIAAARPSLKHPLAVAWKNGKGRDPTALQLSRLVAYQDKANLRAKPELVTDTIEWAHLRGCGWDRFCEELEGRLSGKPESAGRAPPAQNRTTLPRGLTDEEAEAQNRRTFARWGGGTE